MIGKVIPKTCMVRCNFHLTWKQTMLLRDQAKKTGLTKAELVRRAVDQFLKGQK